MREDRRYGLMPRPAAQTKAETATAMIKATEMVVTLSLSAGERVGVRAGVISDCRIYFGYPLRQRKFNAETQSGKWENTFAGRADIYRLVTEPASKAVFFCPDSFASLR